MSSKGKPSKKTILRNVPRKLPTPEEVRSVLEFAPGSSDRVVAIVSAAVAERFLEELLACGFPNLTPPLKPKLFEENGPLSNFYGKTLVAQAMGLINERQAEDLNFIRCIRNAFAHSPFDLTFDTKEVADVVATSPWATAFSNLQLPGGGKLADLNRTIFCSASHFVCLEISNIHKQRTGRPLLVLH